MQAIPGIVLAFIIALPAYLIGIRLPLIGGPVFAILAGMLIALLERPESLQAGITFTAKKILQLAIILLGFQMNLFNVFKVGSESLLVMLCTLFATLFTAWSFAKFLKISGNASLLIGVGTAICGGSAIAAVAPVIQASDEDIAYSISTIFLFNVVAVFIFPPLGHMLELNDASFGLWAGTAVNDTSSVVAVGLAFSPVALEYATIVKLTRTLLIIPMVLALAWYKMRQSRVNEVKVSFIKIFPWFVLGFLLASIISTTGMFSLSAMKTLSDTGKFCIIMAMAAIGLNTNLKKLVANGWRPIALGFACWIVIASTSLLMQFIMGSAKF